MEIDVKCGYEILPDNNLAFKVKVTNNTDLVISNVHVTINHNESLFELQGEGSQRLGLIPPAITRTSEFILKPLGRVHKDTIEASLTYRDHKWEKHTITVRPDGVLCVNDVNSAKDIFGSKNEHVANRTDPVVHGTVVPAGSVNRPIGRQNNALPKNRPETARSVGPDRTTHKSTPEETDDVAKMYDAYLKEVKSKTSDIEKKQDTVLPNSSQRTEDKERKIQKFRGMTAPTRKKMKETKPKRNKKKLIESALFALCILILALSYAVNNPFIMESLGGTVSAGPDSAETVTINFLNAVNSSDFHVALSMCQGQDFLAVASIQMIFTNRGIEGGSIKQIDILSKDVTDDTAVVDVECTVAILDSYGKEEDVEIMPIYFLLQDLEQGWAITQISFTEPFVIGAEDG